MATIIFHDGKINMPEILSLTPGFNQVRPTTGKNKTVSTVCRELDGSQEKPLKRFEASCFATTQLKLGVNADR